MYVRFWGTRGSLATPGTGTIRYGGNTACVELATDGGTLCILDCGSGARLLGLSLNERAGPIEASILLGHTHWDHIQGFPFFAPIFSRDNTFHIYAPSGGAQRLADVLAGQMSYPYFPVSIEQLGATIDFHELGEDDFTVGDAAITTHYMNHTSVCLGYRISSGGRTVVYATDHEPHAWRQRSDEAERSTSSAAHAGDRAHMAFLRDADLVIHDAQYTDAEYPTKIGWGHSSVEHATDAAMEAGVRRLALFHHDPGHDDDFLDRAVEACRERVRAHQSQLEIFGAKEADRIDLPEFVRSEVQPQMPRGVGSGQVARILVVDDDAGVRQVLRGTLTEEGYQVLEAEDGAQALAIVSSEPVDLVLLDLVMPGLDGSAFCRAVRMDERTRRLPIVVLTGAASDTRIEEAFAVGATDFMQKPFAPSQVRARVHGWLVRSRDGSRGGDGMSA